jgi:site-specific DNA recombinase
LDYADEGVESILLGMLGESERLERVWDSGSDNSAELAEINETIIDLTGLLGTGPYKAGTPQRQALTHRITELAARQEQLSAEAVRPSGWTWQPTGEKFGEWWARQDTTARNVWLRSMQIRLEFVQGQLRLDLGDLPSLTEQMNPAGPASEWQAVFEAMRETGVQGLTVGPDGSVVVTE